MPPPLRAWAPPAMVAAGLFLLTVAWALANPPSAAPDEPANFVKAYATATGQLRGERYASPARDLADPRERWFRAAGRVYALPDRLVPPPNARCYAFDPARTAACLDRPAPPRPPGDVVGGTQMGTYPPFLFAPAGLAARTGSDYDDALRRGRLAGALLSSALLGAACALAWDGGRRPFALAAVPVAATPMVLFLAASVTTNGVEVAAAIAWWVALLAAVAPGEGRVAPRRTVVVLASAGVVLALSRLLDPLFVLGSGAVAVAAFGARPAVRAARRSPVALGTVAAACTLTVGWNLVAMPHPPTTWTVAREALGPSWGALGEQARQWVGVFGWLDTRLPGWAYATGWLLLAAPAVAALASRRRGRHAAAGLGLLAAGIVATDLAVAVLAEAPIGYGMQARYVLPLAVGLPVVGAWLAPGLATRDGSGVRRGIGSTAGRVLVAIVGAGGAALHLVAFVANARRYAVGVGGPWLPPWRDAWSPPGGTTLWLAVAATGSLLLAAGVTAGAMSGGGRAAAAEPGWSGR